ncbi:putative ABC transporter ATP-binding protein, partial [Haemophilus influenzae]
HLSYWRWLVEHCVI